LEKSAKPPRLEHFVREIFDFVHEIAFGLCWLRHPSGTVYGVYETPARHDAKSNYTAMKQAYNSRSQAPVVHRNIEAL